MYIGAQVLDHTLRNEDQRYDDGKRDHHVIGGAYEVYPEISDRPRFPALEAADEREQHRCSDCRRHHVLYCESCHLREIRQRRFPGIRLPVRVGYEACRRIIREVCACARKSFRVKGQVALEHIQRKQDRKPKERERQRRERVPPGGLLFLRIDTHNFVGEAFKGRNGLPGKLPRHYLVNVNPERYSDADQGNHIYDVLNHPAAHSFSPLNKT